MKIPPFIWERLRGPFVSVAQPVEYPATFREELNNQCGRIILFAALIFTFAWLPYIPIDRQLYPDEPLILLLRLGLSLIGFTILILQGVRRFERHNLTFILIISIYLEAATGVITGLTGADPAYMGGYLLVLVLIALVPIPRSAAWAILAISILLFFTVGFAKGMHFETLRLHYSLNDLFVTVLIVAIFIYLLDRLRFTSWEKSKRIGQQYESLRESEEFSAQLIAAVPDIVIRTNINGEILYVNEKGIEVSGLAREDIVGRNMLSFVAPEDVETAVQNTILMMEQPIGPKEYHLILKEGVKSLYEVNGSVLKKEDGVPSGMVYILRDISERKRAEVALRQSEERYRIVFEQAAVGVAEIEHHTGRFLTANRRLCELLERTEDEMRNTSFQSITHPEDLHLHEDKSRQLLAGSIDHYTLEKRYLSKSGAAIWVNITVSNPQDMGGAQERNIVVVEDISERKRAEEALRESEEKLQLIVDTIPQIVSIWDMNLKCSYISPMVRLLLGYTPQEAMALNLDQLLTPDSMKVALEAYEEDLRQSQATSFSGHRVRLLELGTYHKNGSVIPLEVTITFLRDAGGVPTGVVMLSTDITERKRAEEALRESEERLRTIIEGTQALLLSVNAEGQLTYVNEATAQALGYPSAAEITGRLYLDFIHPDDRGRVLKSILQQVDAGQPSGNHEFRIVDTQGRVRWYSFVATLITRAGQFAGMTGVAQNITEHKQAEEALRRSEEKYRLLTENIDDVIWTVDTDWRITYASPSIRKLRGLEPEEVMQQTAVESVTPSSLEAILNEFGRVRDEIERGENPTVRLEVEQYRKDGSTVWVEAAVKPMRDDTGCLTGFVGVSRDISVRRKIEASLQASEEKFRHIVGSIPNIVSILDMNLRFTYVSDSVQRIMGYTPEEIMSLSIEQILTPESLAIAVKSFQERLEANARGSDPNYILILELEQYRKNGSTVLLENTMTFLRDANGIPVAILSVSADITERKKAEAALRESEQRLADIIDFLPLATMVIDREGRVTAWNHAMEKITGVQAKAIVGKGDHEYALPFYGERRPILIDLVFASQKELATLYSHIHQHGGVLSAEAYIPKLNIILIGYASALYNSEGNIIGAIESIQDITDIRRVEAELKEARDAADAANRSKSVFLANMSHEIRTPMNAILGFAQLMEREADLSPQAREHLSIINRSGEHLLMLINDILEMSKIEAGRSTFAPDTFDLHTLIEDIERMFSVRTEAKGLQFLMEKVGDIPRWVVTDEGKLRQVLINLLGNAVKFTEEGGIALRLSADRAAGQETVNLRFEVEDTGPGMAEEEMGRLFQAFEQTRAGIKSGGTGLGLALSRGFIHVMGGSISVTSTVGKGTTFRVEVPVREGREEQAQSKAPKRRILRLKPGQDDIRVLIADDRETNRQLLLRLLETVGFTTRPAADGQEAVQAVRTWKPRVVLMDMTMPVMDGYEATQIIKASPGLKDTVVIAVTASAFEEDRQRIVAAGADGYLPKPFKDRDLFETIGRLTGAEYLYEEEGVPERPSPVADGSAEMRRIIQTLPDALVLQMRDAVEGADLDRLNTLFGSLAAEHASLVQGLQSLAARYDYEALIALFSQERNP